MNLFRPLLLAMLVIPCAIAAASDDPKDGNIIPNGDFSKGNVGFLSDLPYIKPADNCLWGGYYTIAARFNEPQLHHLIAPETFQAPTRPHGNEKVFFANAGGPNAMMIWGAKVACKANTKYLISFDCISLSGYKVDGDPPHQVATIEWASDFEIWANDEPSATIQAGLAKYHKGSMIWDSKKATSVIVRIIRPKFPHGGGLIGISNIKMVPVTK